MSERTEDMCYKVLCCFRYGRRNAIHMKDLAKYNSLSTRELRKVIELLRRKGVCIVSDEKGYYFPDNAEDLRKYIKKVEQTAMSTFYTLRTAKEELHKYETE